MHSLFYELIRVAIGTGDGLSRIPTETEWRGLFDIAEKQSLIGVCLVGIHALGADSYDGFTMIGMSEDLYFDWMGTAAQINIKNEIVNEQCVELQKRLAADGFRSCVLKGQGVATLYGEELCGFRQSGDIDVLMWKDGLTVKENRKAVIEYAKILDKNARASEHHIAVKVFDDTEVEMHYIPAYLCNPFINKRLQSWFGDYDKTRFQTSSIGANTPNIQYNIVFLLAHAFRHYLGGGLGLRQLMDYYFVLKSKEVVEEEVPMKVVLDRIGLYKFASAVMYVMKNVFGMDDAFLLCEPNAKVGRLLLKHVMQGGNFGHFNQSTIANSDTHFGRFANQVLANIRLLRYYPEEAIWAPFATIKNYIQIRIKN